MRYIHCFVKFGQSRVPLVSEISFEMIAGIVENFFENRGDTQKCIEILRSLVDVFDIGENSPHDVKNIIYLAFTTPPVDESIFRVRKSGERVLTIHENCTWKVVQLVEKTELQRALVERGNIAIGSRGLFIS